MSEPASPPPAAALLPTPNPRLLLAARASAWLWLVCCGFAFVWAAVLATRWPLAFEVAQGVQALSGDSRLLVHVRGRAAAGTSEPAPLAGAVVRVFAVRADETVALVTQGNTEPDGSVALEQLPGGTVWVLVEAEGHNRKSMTLRLFGERNLNFALEASRPLQIRVLDDAQQPLPDATVLVQDADALPFGALSDAQGKAAFPRLGPPPYRLSVFAKGYESYERTGLNKDQDVILRRLGGLSVQVTTESGEPLAAAEVSIVGSSFWPGRRLETDSAGKAQMTGLLAGMYDVRARKGALISPLAASVRLERGEHKELQLKLVQGRFIEVHCHSERPDALPVADADIVVSELGLSPFPLSARSDADGRARIGPLSFEPAFASVSRDGFVGRNSVPIPAELTEPLRIELLHGATLQGRVVDAHGHSIVGASVEIIGFDLDGLPISESPELVGYRKAHFQFALSPLPLIPAGELGVTQGRLPYVNEVSSTEGWGQDSASNNAWLSDIEGRFTAYPVPPGRVRALVRHPGYVEGLSETFELQPGDEQAVTVILQDGGHLLGRVVDPRGFPVGGVRIQVTAPNASYERNMSSNDAGAFELAATPREINVALARPSDPLRFVLRETVRVESGTDTEHEFVLPDARESLLWLVRDESEQPVELAQVTLASLDPKVPLRATRFSGDDGLVGIEDAAGLDVQVNVQAPGFAPLSVRLREAPAEHTFTLHRGTRVQGEVTAVRGHLLVSGAEVALESDERRVTTLTDGAGRFDFGDVPRGHATLTIRHDDYAPFRKELDIVDTGRDDRPLDLETIDLDEGASAEGVVQDAEGEPVAGARVSLGTPSGHLVRGGASSGSATTDAEGRFQLRGLPAGEHVLGALAPTRERGSLSVLLTAGEQLTDLVVTLQAAAELDEIGSHSGGVAADFGDAESEEGSKVQVRSVEASSEAERAGLRPGDYIVEIDGAQVGTVADARARCTGRVGQDVIVSVERSGQRRAFRVRLESIRH